MKNRFSKKFITRARLVVLLLALALSATACGGQSLDGACSDVCTKLGNCLGENDPAAIAACEADCTADGEATPVCEDAIYDAADCIPSAECAGILGGTECQTEISALEAACPGA